tara:strand:+ start:16777 stop:17355 length:579 start_codon:yes stop_codon:yes gene_type:complete
MRILHAMILVVLASTLVLETAYANTYKMNNLSMTDGTYHSWALIYKKVPVLNRGQVNNIQNCTITETPIYSNTQGEALGSIFGMLIGGILGHKMGGDNGAVAGALIGGVTGNQASADPNANRTIVGYRKRKHCTSTPVKNKGSFEVIGYIYYMKDAMTGNGLPTVGSQANPSTKNYAVGQKIPYRAGVVLGN